MRLITKLVKAVTSRAFVVGVLILAQLIFTGMFFFFINTYVVYIQIASWILATVLILDLFNKRGSPSTKLPWVLILAVIPVFGVPFYIFCGNTDLNNRYKKSLAQSIKQTETLHIQDENVAKRLKEKNITRYREADFIYRTTKMPVHKNTKITYFSSGEKVWEMMLEKLKEAKHFIFIEFFIVEEGKMWNSILDILKEKVNAGVEVRFMYDDWGCIQTLPFGYENQLIKMGIDCVVFNPFNPILTIGHNYRDHRKICVVDGYIGFTGGINLADEYINEKVRFGHWKDSAIMLEGEAVWNQTISFLENWDYTKKIHSDFAKYSPHVYHPGTFESNTDGYVVPFADNPLDNELVCQGVYLNLINNATNYIYITTPYLVTDNELATAICLAAKRGVDVRIITPGIPDKWYVYLMTRAYYQEFIEAGVRIFEYSPGFMHSKNILSDDKVAVCGTINMDYRSLYHNFECACWMYEGEAISQMKHDFDETFLISNQITLEWCKNRSLFIRVMQSIFRVFSPLL